MLRQYLKKRQKIIILKKLKFTLYDANEIFLHARYLVMRSFGRASISAIKYTTVSFAEF